LFFYDKLLLQIITLKETSVIRFAVCFIQV